MVTEFLMIAGKAQHVFNTMGVGAQDIGLHCQAIPVAANHLVIWFETLLHDQKAGCPAGHSYHGRLIVGDVYRIHHSFQVFGFLYDFLGIGAPWWTKLACKGKMTGPQDFFQVTS